MHHRWSLILVVFWSSVGFAQLIGRFYLEKQTFASGEPVYLHFEVVNDGTEGHQISRSDPYSFCSGYHIRVSTDPHPSSSCERGFAGSCLSSSELLIPGKSRTERILLNYEHDIAQPGEYDVEAVRYLSYGDAKADLPSQSWGKIEVRNQLHFRVDDNSFVDQEMLNSLVAQLKSERSEVRTEAARALASLGPRSLESTLLKFADSDEFKRYAPLAFSRLDTKASMSGLAELIINNKPGTYEHMESAKYLATSGDAQWFPMLAEIAKNNAQIYNYVAYAAESGGDKAIPMLLALMHSPDKVFASINAISAFGYTGSRASVPILLNLLRSPDAGTAQRALYGLRTLTHKSVGGERGFENPQAQYSRWSEWWARSQSTARVYRASECGELAELP